MKLHESQKYFTCIFCAVFFTNFYQSYAQHLLLDPLNNSLSNYGFNVQFNYKGEVFSNLSGGVQRKSVYLDNFDFIMNINLDNAAGWHGAELKTYVLGNNGKTPSELSGTGQGNSNIASYNTWKIYEFWIQQNLFDDKLSLLIGLYDLNSEFDNRKLSSVFINPSHGIGPDFSLTGQNGPSIFPTTSLAFRAHYNFTDYWNVKAALLDGVPGNPDDPRGTHIQLNGDDGLLIAAELTYKNSVDEINDAYFKYSVGAWYYTSEFQHNLQTKLAGESIVSSGNYGAYLSAEKLLFVEQENNQQGLGSFVRIGYSDPEVNRVDFYLGTGLTYFGILPGRDDDVLALSVALARNSYDYVKSLASESIQIEKYETVIELTYELQMLDWIKLQPDMQYVIDPVYSPGSKNALLFGTRLQLAL